MTMNAMCSDSADDDDDGGSRATSVDELDLVELTRSHSLPSHILHLRPVEPDVSGHQQLHGGATVSVHSISTVLRGSQFGPFNCHVVECLQTSPTDDCTASDECHFEASTLNNILYQRDPDDLSLVESSPLSLRTCM